MVKLWHPCVANTHEDGKKSYSTMIYFLYSNMYVYNMPLLIFFGQNNWERFVEYILHN